MALLFGESDWIAKLCLGGENHFQTTPTCPEPPLQPSSPKSTGSHHAAPPGGAKPAPPRGRCCALPAAASASVKFIAGKLLKKFSARFREESAPRHKRRPENVALGSKGNSDQMGLFQKNPYFFTRWYHLRVIANRIKPISGLCPTVNSHRPWQSGLEDLSTDVDRPWLWDVLSRSSVVHPLLWAAHDYPVTIPNSYFHR